MAADAPLILHVFSTFAAGGPQVRTVQLIDALGSKFRHQVFAMDGRYDAMALLQTPDHVEKARPPDDREHFFRRILNYRRWLKAEKPDVLATYNWGAIEVATAAQFIPTMRHIHHEEGFGPEEARTQLKRRIIFRRLALRKANAVVVPSQQLFKLASETWQLSRKHLHLIENGVDVGAFNQPKSDAIPGLVKKEDSFVVGTVAGLRPEKNLTLLVRAFAALCDEMPNAILAIVGEGAERALIKAEAQKRDVLDKLLLPGFIPRPQDYLGLFDIFVISSDTEQFPISLVEAMAATLPIVATDVGDVRAVLPARQHDFISAPGDERGLGKALIAMAKDKDLRHVLGQMNKERAAVKYGFDKTIEAYKTLYLGS